MAVLQKNFVGTIILDGTDTDTYDLVVSTGVLDIIGSLQGSILGVDAKTSTGAVVMELPALADLPVNKSNLVLCISDADANAALKNITVRANSTAGDRINGGDAAVIDVNGASLVLRACGGQWIATNAAI